MASKLFTDLTLHASQGPGLMLRNRTFVSPMCQYQASADGVPTAWHTVHYGSFATGGFGLVTVESTAVEARGRISDQDLGLWSDKQIAGHRAITEFVRSQGAGAAVQLGHAGGKASTRPALPGEESGPLPEGRRWPVVAPSAQEVQPGLLTPTQMTQENINEVIQAFRDAALRADAAGYEAVQLHGAHGYLIHEFFSGLSNHRTDAYGGTVEARSRFALEVAQAVRAVWPEHKPLGLRLSASDWVEDGVSVFEAAHLARLLVEEAGVSWVDVSSGGIHPDPKVIPVGPGYQVGLAAAVRAELNHTDAVVSAVGLITDPVQAETVVASGQADAVSVARAALRNPHWSGVAARELRVPLDANPASDAYWRGMR